MTETKLAVVSHSLTGSLDEKVRAFEQMAGAMAQLQLNGWDTVQKCKAGFWLADGCGEHPAVFVQNHWVLKMHDKLMIEPKWEYMVRKLTETVPGFVFEVIEEGNERATVKMSDGKSEHVVTYSVDDAKRQGLYKGAWLSNPREMCFKQATKRAARRIGVGRAVPWADVDAEEYEDIERDVQVETAKAVSAAVVVEGHGAAGEDPDMGTPSEVTKPSAPDDVAKRALKSPIAALSSALIRYYGKQPKGVALEKATFLYNEMVKAETGEDPGARFKSVDDIGPVDAERVTAYIEQKIAGNAAPEAKPAPAVDEAPPAETVEAAPEAEAEATIDEDYATFVAAVKRARKVFDRKFLVEAPPGGKKWWFVDQATFSQAGHAASLKVMEADGEVVIGQAMLRQLTRIMLADCDAHERGSR